eukprot:scaffold10723_cov113-Isochrysis_galbana.AAC.10
MRVPRSGFGVGVGPQGPAPHRAGRAHVHHGSLAVIRSSQQQRLLPGVPCQRLNLVRMVAQGEH